MSGPNAIVERAGETVGFEFVVDYELDAGGQVINEEIEYLEIPAVVSQPSEEDQQRLDGRLGSGSIRLTVRSDPITEFGFGDGTFGTSTFGGEETETVRSDRGGRRDRVIRPAPSLFGDGEFGDGEFGGSAEQRVYEIVDVTRDRHPLTNTTKTTAIADQIGGR